MVITCIAAVGIVLFPMIRKSDPEKLKGFYDIVRNITTLPILVLLIFYTPISLLLELWLPQYADSLKYLAVLLPVCIFEARSSVLTNTYFKVFNQGGRILLVNASSVALSLILTGVMIYVLGNLDLAVISIVILVAFKNIFAELLLQKNVNRKALPDILLEQVLTWAFIIFNWNMDGLTATILYTICFIIYLFIKRNNLIKTFKSVKKLAFERK